MALLLSMPVRKPHEEQRDSKFPFTFCFYRLLFSNIVSLFVCSGCTTTTTASFFCVDAFDHSLCRAETVGCLSSSRCCGEDEEGRKEGEWEGGGSSQGGAQPATTWWYVPHKWDARARREDAGEERGERREERDGKTEVTHSNIDITPLTTHCTCSMQITSLFLLSSTRIESVVTRHQSLSTHQTDAFSTRQDGVSRNVHLGCY